MDNQDQYHLGKLFQIILSQKSEEEQQRDALQYLQSHPNTLPQLIKHVAGQVANDQTADRKGHDDNTQTSAQLDEGENACILVSDEIQFESHLSNVGYNQSDHMLDKCSQQGLLEIGTEASEGDLSLVKIVSEDNGSAIEGFDFSTPMSTKKKSKYSDLNGDFNHLYRDPKCSNIRPKRKYQRRILSGMTSGNMTLGLSQRHNDVISVQRLIDMLIHSKSQKQQEYIISLLRTDDNLMKIFHEEKAKIGSTDIPVFKSMQPEFTTKRQPSFTPLTNGEDNIDAFQKVTDKNELYDEENSTDSIFNIFTQSSDLGAFKNDFSQNPTAAECTVDLQDGKFVSINENCFVQTNIKDATANFSFSNAESLNATSDTDAFDEQLNQHTSW